MIAIREVEQVDDHLVAAMTRLLPQLSRSAPPPTTECLDAIVTSPATTLLVAEDDASGTGPDRIVGTLTLAVFQIPSGVRAWIEDVITDERSRGRGIGGALTRRALEIAAASGARTVDLTTRPSREVANRLYLRLGFEPRETNVYRYPSGG